MRVRDMRLTGRFLTSRPVFLLAGHLCLAVGVIGLLIPVMPSSPFVILAAVCYARSSERCYLLLLNNRYFGEDVRLWLERRCVRGRVRFTGALMLAVAFSVTVLVFITPLWARLTVGCIGCLAVIATLRLPSCKE